MTLHHYFYLLYEGIMFFMLKVYNANYSSLIRK